MENEKTSGRIAKIASLILKTECLGGIICVTRRNGGCVRFRWDDIQAIAGSALTQAADKKRPAKKR